MPGVLQQEPCGLRRLQLCSTPLSQSQFGSSCLDLGEVPMACCTPSPLISQFVLGCLLRQCQFYSCPFQILSLSYLPAGFLHHQLLPEDWGWRWFFETHSSLFLCLCEILGVWVSRACSFQVTLLDSVSEQLQLVLTVACLEIVSLWLIH